MPKPDTNQGSLKAWCNIRIRRDVLKKVDKLAEKEDRTRSSMMALLVQEALTLRNEDIANH